MNYNVLSKYRGELMGLAILFVVMFHVYMPGTDFFYPLRRLGNVGVDMFLFVSGMGLWFSWTRSRLGRNLDGVGGMSVVPALKRFFSRRYLRIYPVWILVAAYFYVGKYVENPGGGYSPDVPNLIANVLFNWSFWRADDLTFWYVPATMMLYNFAPPYMELIRRQPAWRWLPVAFILLAACPAVSRQRGTHRDILQPHTDILHRHKLRRDGDGQPPHGEGQPGHTAPGLRHEHVALSAP